MRHTVISRNDSAFEGRYNTGEGVWGHFFHEISPQIVVERRNVCLDALVTNKMHSLKLLGTVFIQIQAHRE